MVFSTESIKQLFLPHSQMNVNQVLALFRNNPLASKVAVGRPPVFVRFCAREELTARIYAKP